ncbi:glutamate racemase [Umboniibacter marinipuniceus]|uniref:Glutamate racemase n=1 Tax=Umboniibacter marinipuniceus TaxID=569599 RepID=A0A3M0A8X8_9GAMM|nr:glutamate racemase [Umboniibacter marinipuniceus]RMA81066.1 glutamate racemase [Umboniibacter marinipuniceus]
MSVLIFDSGLGGLSIRREIQLLRPDLSIHQFADHAWLPYGAKRAEDIRSRMLTLIPEMVDRVNASLLVVACNTASTHTLPQLRATLNIPVVGVVPAIKPAAIQSATKSIAVLATERTITSQYLDELIQSYAANCQVTRIGANQLVELAESKLSGNAVDTSELRKILPRSLFPSSVDTLVLACTHFPLLKTELLSVLPDHIELIDSGNAIARRVSTLASLQSHPQPAEFFTTGTLNQATVRLLQAESFARITAL